MIYIVQLQISELTATLDFRAMYFNRRITLKMAKGQSESNEELVLIHTIIGYYL